MNVFAMKKMRMVIYLVILCFLSMGQGFATEKSSLAEIEQDTGIDSLVAQGIGPAEIFFNQECKIIAPNSKGFYPRLLLENSSEIQARVFFPDALSGEQILIFSEDGGLFKGQALSGQVVVDNAHSVSFRFQPLKFDGLYRISLYRGGERRILQFWVGSLPGKGN